MSTTKKHIIILFDGHCNLCNNTVNFLIDRDPKDRFRFASLQSTIGKKMLSDRDIDPKKIDSIVCIVPGEAYYTKANAAIKIALTLGKGWAIIGMISNWFPTSLKNTIYDWVARNRYKWFGKQDQCRIPTPELQTKFLTEETPSNEDI
ncbi:MAG: DCC1-like thiol-disulfide oxidoreductase family protein [Flavobacteriaceae bacterium]|nr:DCC1-like thiol-disulfide oxidoreductase family protein [Flavobacteriaceae bacterium]